MKFEGFSEVEHVEYGEFSGERICYWDNEHVQHFFIKVSEDYKKQRSILEMINKLQEALKELKDEVK